MTYNQDPTEAQLDQANRSISGSFAFTAVRCTLQYIVFPFVLPFLGLSGTISIIISLILEGTAVGIIIYNIITLWSTSWRWRYLVMGSLMLSVLGVFLYSDIQILFMDT